ncbi:MAG: DUF4276 family protein [Isosphaeraceae bacterium]|nr:DUF4276 family protein [Isosphaeraceae bacterium]
MNRVIAVVEGPTEATFVKDVLAPWIVAHGVSLSARIVGKPGKKGGVGEFDRAFGDIETILKSDRVAFVTTMLDYYGMPPSWPGRLDSKSQPVAQRGEFVEKAIAGEVAKRLGSSLSKRFLPYVQMHEYEALLFSGPDEIARVLDDQRIRTPLDEILEQFGNPEAIDDDPATAPSKRLTTLHPGYRKISHGKRIAEAIGIDAIRRECPHFDGWIERLIGATRDSTRPTRRDP